MQPETNEITPRGKLQQDLVAGLVLVTIAGTAWWASSDLPVGSLTNMGPGMVPRLLQVLLGIVGFGLCIKSMLVKSEEFRLSDHGAILAVAALLVVAALAGGPLVAVNLLGLSGFTLAFCFLYFSMLAALLILKLAGRDYLSKSGLRGPLFVFGGLLSFAIFIRHTGLVVAGPSLAVISGMASQDVEWAKLAVFALVMTALCVVLFKYALGLPIPVLIIPGFVHI